MISYAKSMNKCKTAIETVLQFN